MGLQYDGRHKGSVVSGGATHSRGRTGTKGPVVDTMVTVSLRTPWFEGLAVDRGPRAKGQGPRRRVYSA